MAFRSFIFLSACFLLLTVFPFQIHAELSHEDLEKINRVNARGDHDCLIVAQKSELDAIMSQHHGTFEPYKDMPVLDISNQRFHIGNMAGRRAILVMSGSGPLNSARAAQIMLNVFRVRAVIHYGIARNANPEKLNIGDVAVPARFADCGSWYWEKFGGDEGNYDRDIAKLTFSEYNTKSDGENKLESVYLQRSNIYQTPEKEERTIFIGVDRDLYERVQNIEGMELERCAKDKSGVCLAEQPRVKRVERGCSAFVHVNNEAFRDFLRQNLNIATLDNTSAAIASVCYSMKKPFIAFRSITHFAGGSPPEENEAKVISDLWPQHFHTVMRGFFNVMPNQDSNLRSVTGSAIL